tara:strand:+ start:2930 stop:3676 length:747 start_codon:yes stop_codon:yes gene_type:complete
MTISEITSVLQTDGVVLVEDAMSDNQCQRLLDGIEWGFHNREGPLPLQRQRTYEWFREHPIFIELLEHPLVIAVADACLGPDYHLICAETTRNERDNHFLEAVKNVHQDHCFFPEDQERLVEMQTRMYGFTAQWVAHDIPHEMGPTEFIVGSHVDHRRYTNEEAPSAIDYRDHFPKGSLVFYDHRTWHRGTDNHADRPRDLTQNCYALHAVDKVQIRTPQPNGPDVYEPCTDLIESGSEIIRKLLSRV